MSKIIQRNAYEVCTSFPPHSLPYVCGTKSIIYYISIQLRIKVWKKSMRLKNSEVKNWRPVVPIKSEHNEKSEYNPLINLIYWLHYTYS